MAVGLVPETLRHVVIVSPKTVFGRVLASMLELGIFHPLEPSVSMGEPLGEAKRILFEVNEYVSRFEEYYSVLEVVPPSIVGKERLEVDDWIKAGQKVLDEAVGVDKSLESLSRIALEYKARLQELERQASLIEPISFLDVDLEKLRSLKHFIVYVARIPLPVAKAVVKELERVEGILTGLRQLSEEEALLLVVAPRSLETRVMAVMQSYRVSYLELPEEMPSNPAEAYKSIRSEIERLLEEQRKFRNEVRRSLPQSFEIYYKLLTLREAFRIYSSARAMKLFLIVEGYVPQRRLKEFLDRVSEAGSGSVLVITRKEVHGLREKPPTYVKIPWYVKPIHMITEMYGVPSPKELVPTIFMVISFPIIYGLMFPDAGHALLLLIGGWYFYTHSKGSRSRKIFGMLVIYVGITSFITGILAAEFFGPWNPVSEALTKLFGGHPPYASPVHPLAEKMIAGEKITAAVSAEAQDLLMNIMFLSLRIGAIMLVLGTLLGFLDSLLEENYEEAFLTRLPKMLIFFFATMPFLVAPTINKAAMYIGVATGLSHTHTTSIVPGLVRWGYLIALLALILGEPIMKAAEEGAKAFKTAFSDAFMEGFETLLMTISNTASFFRIMGLELAHSGLMFGFTILALMVYGGPVGVLSAVAIYIMGNLLVAGLEAIIVFAHTLRLHFYEFFSKFYKGQGVRYEPARTWMPITLRM